jgi:hypothetical protein
MDYPPVAGESRSPQRLAGARIKILSFRAKREILNHMIIL